MVSRHIAGRLTLVVVLLAAVLLLAGCGSDKERETIARPVKPQRTAPKAEPVPATPAAQPAQPDALPAEPSGIEKQPPVVERNDVADFDLLENQLGGSSGVAVAPIGLGTQVTSYGSLKTGAAWSTMKVPIAMATLAQGRSEAKLVDIRSALRRSDNAAAERLWTGLGGGERAARAVATQLRAAGDDATAVESQKLRPEFSAFGQTGWSLEDQARYMAGLACSALGSATLKEMGAVAADQRWGLGTLGANVPFKGGWGPGTKPGVASGYLVRQMGIVTAGGQRVAVAVATVAADGSFETGSANLTAIARWVARNASLSDVPASQPC